MQDLQSLLQYHAKADQKKGSGVQGFSVMQMTPNSKSFAVVRTDGTRTDFSYHKCMTKACPVKDLRRALHATIKPMLDSHKGEAFKNGTKLDCPYTGEPLTERNAVVSFSKPGCFNDLVDSWLRKVGKGASELELESRDKKMGARLKDKELVASFKQFFAQQAVLEVVSRTGASMARLSLKDSDVGMDDL